MVLKPTKTDKNSKRFLSPELFKILKDNLPHGCYKQIAEEAGVSDHVVKDVLAGRYQRRKVLEVAVRYAQEEKRKRIALVREIQELEKTNIDS